MHRKVKEILQSLYFLCPGCKTRYKYDDVTDHALKCDKVDSKLKLTHQELAFTVASNNKSSVTTLPTQGSKASPMSNEVFVLDKDYYRVYVYNLMTRTHQIFDLVYQASDSLYSTSRENK